MVRVRDNTCYYRVWMNNVWKRGNIISVFQNIRIHVDRACVGSQWFKEYTTSRENCQTKIPLEVTSAISDCPHEDSQNCWHLNVLYHLTILCFHSKCNNMLHFRRNMQKAKTDIEQVWFLFSPPHLFRHLSFLLVVFPFCFR